MHFKILPYIYFINVIQNKFVNFHSLNLQTPNSHKEPRSLISLLSKDLIAESSIMFSYY